jgi:DNA-3-methyladenine glycosylase I
VTAGSPVVRCPWGDDPAMIAYHDLEWGRELRGDTALFERLSLEAFQSGLSWAIILRKREGFRAAFAGFDPPSVAAFGDADVARLLGDAGIVRNRLKIEATIANARTLLALDESFDELLWSFAPPPAPAPATFADVPATTPESVALARALKQRGFRFVGPTTAYALMQATGMVNDHLADCVAREAAGPGAARSSGDDTPT